MWNEWIIIKSFFRSPFLDMQNVLVVTLYFNEKKWRISLQKKLSHQQFSFCADCHVNKLEFYHHFLFIVIALLTNALDNPNPKWLFYIFLLQPIRCVNHKKCKKVHFIAFSNAKIIIFPIASFLISTNLTAFTRYCFRSYKLNLDKGKWTGTLGYINIHYVCFHFESRIIWK